jgi:hypothetical protein
MRQFDVRIAEMSALGGLVRFVCDGPPTGALPGQLCLAQAETAPQPFLRLPIYPLPGERPAFLVPAGHALARLAPGDRLDLIGPIGHGFQLPAPGGHLLVIAATLERVLPAIEQAVAQSVAVTLMSPRAATGLPAEVELHRGPLTAELAGWADVVVLDVAEPRDRAEHVRAMAPLRGAEFVQALMAPLMPCGLGACQACWVEPRPGRSRRLACQDGPVFTL